MVMPWELSILDGAHALLLKAKLAIIGNTTITGDLDVSGEIIGGTIPIENLSNVDKQSFDNLIDNGDFKLWSVGNSNAPDDWSVTADAVSKSSTIKAGVNSVSILNTAASSGSLYKAISNTEYAYREGRTFTLGCWILANDASRVRLELNDKTAAGWETSHSDFHSGGGSWEWLTITRTYRTTLTDVMYLSIQSVSGSAITFNIDGVIFVEGSICPAFSPKPLTAPHTYGEMYIYNNSNAAVIETANTPIALRQISGGLQKGFIFDAGATGGITGYADNSGSVAGTVLVLCVANHNLTTGDIITIRGTTNYNGIFEVVVTGADQLYIIDTWVANDGASDWDKGASLTAQAGADGVYTSTWQMTTAPAGACELCFKVNINETPQNKSTACRDMAINDKDNNSSTCLMTIVEGDIIWLSVESDATSNITNSMGNMNLERM